MCSGEMRREMLRQMYRLGYESGQEDLRAELAAGHPEPPFSLEGVVSLDEYREQKEDAADRARTPKAR